MPNLVLCKQQLKHLFTIFQQWERRTKFPLTLIDIHAQLPPFEQEHNREMKIQCEMDKYRLVNRLFLEEIIFNKWQLAKTWIRTTFFFIALDGEPLKKKKKLSFESFHLKAVFTFNVFKSHPWISKCRVKKTRCFLHFFNWHSLGSEILHSDFEIPKTERILPHITVELYNEQGIFTHIVSLGTEIQYQILSLTPQMKKLRLTGIEWPSLGEKVGAQDQNFREFFPPKFGFSSAA